MVSPVVIGNVSFVPFDKGAVPSKDLANTTAENAKGNYSMKVNASKTVEVGNLTSAREYYHQPQYYGTAIAICLMCSLLLTCACVEVFTQRFHNTGHTNRIRRHIQRAPPAATRKRKHQRDTRDWRYHRRQMRERMKLSKSARKMRARGFRKTHID